MPEKAFFIIAVTLMLTAPAYASASFNIVAQVIAPIEITRTLPSQVNTSQQFDVNLNFSNLVNLELFNISIKETIPIGYKIIKIGKIFPRPSYVGIENGSTVIYEEPEEEPEERIENGSTVIYWNISRMANYANLSIKYSLSAPKSAGNYTFRADASCFDASGDRFAAYNVTNQVVQKPPLWKSILEFLGISS